MRCKIPEISWHNKEPVLSVDINPHQGLKANAYRVATGGGDNHVLIWQITINGMEMAHECIADLTRHHKSVNIVRWSPCGQYLASGDDDANIIIWSQNPDVAQLDDEQESWRVHKVLRGHKEDVTDLCWSPCGLKLMSGSIDNTAIMWNVKKGKLEQTLATHHGFVQGVAWDPKNDFVATIGTDRVLRLFTVGGQLKHKINKGTVPVSESHYFYNKEVKYFYDDTYKSFYRRMEFSPDGSLILVPSARLESANLNEVLDATLAFAKTNLTSPSFVFPHDQCSTCVRFCPLLFKLREDGPAPYIDAPYRMVFCIGLEQGIAFYDTQQPEPFSKLSGCHYTRLTDMSWSTDGSFFFASSTDGYCTLVNFEPGELGDLYENKEISTSVENTMESTCQKKNPVESSFLKQWAQGAKVAMNKLNSDSQELIEVDKENKGNISEVKPISVRRVPRVISTIQPIVGEVSITEKNKGTKTSSDDKLTPIEENTSTTNKEGKVTSKEGTKTSKEDKLTPTDTKHKYTSEHTQQVLTDDLEISSDEKISGEESVGAKPSDGSEEPVEDKISSEKMSFEENITSDSESPIIKQKTASSIFWSSSDEKKSSEESIPSEATPEEDSESPSIKGKEVRPPFIARREENIAPLDSESQSIKLKRISPIIVISSDESKTSNEEIKPDAPISEENISTPDGENPSTKQETVHPVIIISSDESKSGENISPLNSQSPSVNQKSETISKGTTTARIHQTKGPIISSSRKRVIQQTLPTLVKLNKKAKEVKIQTTDKNSETNLNNGKRKRMEDTSRTTTEPSSSSTKKQRTFIDLTLSDDCEESEDIDKIPDHDQDTVHPAPVPEPKAHRMPRVTIKSPKRKTDQSKHADH